MTYPDTYPSATPSSHAEVATELRAVGLELGLNPSGSFATVLARLDDMANTLATVSTGQSYIYPITFNATGPVSTGTGTSAVTVEYPSALEIVRANVGLTTPPGGSTLTVDVNKNGTTIYGNQGARPAIPIAGTTALGGAATVTTFAAGDRLTVDVDQVGSTVGAPGSDLTVTVWLRRTA
jgi:hypothetical protein